MPLSIIVHLDNIVVVLRRIPATVEICCPPTTHLEATIDDLTDMLNFDSEDIDGVDEDAGDEQ